MPSENPELAGYENLHGGGLRFNTLEDALNYNMTYRLKLAKLVKDDGNTNGRVADLGSSHGGMTYALKESGAKDVVSTEFEKYRCETIKENVNDVVVRCDSFRLPFRDKSMRALVSYMFLGQNLPTKRGVAKVFEELSRVSDTIYGVELQEEYSMWFTEPLRTPEEIEARLNKELGKKFEVNFLGKFGRYELEGNPSDRIGFKFTRKKEEPKKDTAKRYVDSLTSFLNKLLGGR